MTTAQPNDRTLLPLRLRVVAITSPMIILAAGFVLFAVHATTPNESYRSLLSSVGWLAVAAAVAQIIWLRDRGDACHKVLTDELLEMGKRASELERVTALQGKYILQMDERLAEAEDRLAELSRTAADDLLRQARDGMRETRVPRQPQPVRLELRRNHDRED